MKRTAKQIYLLWIQESAVRSGRIINSKVGICVFSRKLKLTWAGTTHARSPDKCEECIGHVVCTIDINSYSPQVHIDIACQSQRRCHLTPFFAERTG